MVEIIKVSSIVKQLTTIELHYKNLLINPSIDNFDQKIH